MPPAIERLSVSPSVRARDRAVLGQEGAVGQEDARGVVGDGAAVQQVPGLAVGVDRPAADHARVEEVQALVARPVDLAVRFGDQHRLAWWIEICGGPTWTLNDMVRDLLVVAGPPSLVSSPAAQLPHGINDAISL